MISNYFIYLSTLSKDEKLKQVLIILTFFLILFAVCCFLEFLKLKFTDKTKNSLFQKFLKKL